MKKKGQMEGLMALAVGVATLALALTVAFLVMSQGKDQIATIESLDTDGDGTLNATECRQSMACNSTMELQSATDQIPGWVPLIIIAIIGGVLLGIVRFFKSS